MAGLGRVQLRFTHALIGTLAALIGFARGDKQAATRFATTGHPLLAKFTKTNPPRANTPGYDYPGYGTVKRTRAQRAGLIPYGG